MTKPLPSGYEVNALEQLWGQTILDEFVAPYIANNIYEVWKKAEAFLEAHALLIFSIIFIIGALNFILSRLKKRQYNIQKLWQFILFFLSKRIMMIPLLYTLGKKANALDENAFNRLLELRDESKHHSLTKDPQERISIEQQISEILVQYFDNLESQGHLDQTSVFHHLVDDLEYIDKKLVELQRIYNHQATKWNRWFQPKFFRYIGLKNFDTFE